MGNRSEEKKVLNALRDLLRKKPVGERQFVFRTTNEATECLGLRGAVRTRTLQEALKSLNSMSKIHMATFDGRTTITIPGL